MSAPLVLASASPQRKELLAGLGLPFEVVVSGVNEAACPHTDPVRRCVELARLKAADVAAKRPDAWVIGCDTLVVAADGTLLEKPADADEARRMIRLQAGQTSWVHSGLALRSPEGQEWHDSSSSAVTFRAMTDADTEWWIQGGFWQGRSGGFQIDGLGQLMIARIEGDWTSIVGLPVFLLGELMRKAGAPFLVSGE